MSHLPTLKRVVTETPSAAYRSPSSPPTQQQSTPSHLQSPFSEASQRRNPYPQGQSQDLSRRHSYQQPDDEGSFRAPGVHSILNPLHQTIQPSLHTSNQRSDQGHVTSSISTSLPSTSPKHSSPQAREFEPAPSHDYSIAGASVSPYTQSTNPTFPVSSQFSHHRSPSLKSYQTGETAEALQESHTLYGAGSPTKRRRLVQTPPELGVHEIAPNNLIDTSRYSTASNPQAVNAGPSRSAEFGTVAEGPPFSQVERLQLTPRPLGQGSLSSPERQLSPQFMTLQTDQGPLYLPVDRQAASRLADEKRRRNAGASARFRARRKEREQASSREIDGLKSIIRNLGDEVEFYRRERDYLANVLLQEQDQSRHFPRPPSPRRYRKSTQSVDISTFKQRRDSGDMSPLYHGQEESENPELSLKEPFQPIAQRKSQLPSAAASQPSHFGERIDGYSPSRGLASQGQQQLQYNPELAHPGEQRQSATSQSELSPGHPNLSQSPYGR